MMEISIKQGSILDQSCDLLIVNLFSSKGGSASGGKGVTNPAGATGEVNKRLEGKLVDMMKQDRFEGNFGEWLVFPTFGAMKAKKVAVIGLGERADFSLDAIRRLGALIVKRSREAHAKSVVTILHGAGVAGLPVREVTQALSEGMRLGAYHFHAYKEKEKKDWVKKDVKTIVLCEQERGKIAPAERGLAEAIALTDATLLARDLVNTPSAHMTPAILAEAAKSVAGAGKRIGIKILDKQKMERLGMHAALAVAQGSSHEPVGVHMTYKPAPTPSSSPSGRGRVKKVVIVGKAVTFDSGGLSIKPSDGMMTMKIDMAGAASVIGLFKALPMIEPNVEVHGIFLAVENMPSGTAYRPGDVIKAMNGTTIEVLNTDAEGRVTLADALSYAVTLKPDAIVDLATLTGACIAALGEDVAGLLTNDRKLGDKILSAAKDVGEELWELPLYKPYGELIKSKVGDIKNIGGGHGGGTITAALFLQHFVGNLPWAHLDIAGPSYAERETRPDMPFGGTGYGVRLLAKYLQNL